MILMTGFFLDEVPFKTAYIHGIVRDQDKKKMSKSKGNAVDPLGIAETYGMDAVRMALVVGNAPGTDPVISEDKIRGYRNFATKCWNIGRFLEMNGVFSEKATSHKPLAISEQDKRYVADFEAVHKKITNLMDTYQFHEASNEIYHYIWHTFADKIVEEVKPRIREGNDADSARAMLYNIFRRSLVLLHPFMPFVTEAIYQEYFAVNSKEKMLITATWQQH